MLPKINNIDIHAAHLCNLHCEQCSHFSNYAIDVPVTVEEIKETYESWHKKISLNFLGVAGGEPLLNKNILEILELSSYYWKETSVGLHTNGLLLERFPELPKVLKKNNIRLVISSHYSTGSTEVYHKKFQSALQLAKQWVDEYGIILNISGFNFINQEFFSEGEVYVKQPQPWGKGYSGYGKTMTPLDSNVDYVSSWNACGAKNCMQLYNNKLYKCSVLAYLPLLDKKVGGIESKDIKVPLSYIPLSADCSEQELLEFINRGPEIYCGGCPTQKHMFIPSHDPMKLQTE